MALVVLLSDRTPDDVLPAIGQLLLDLKTQHLSAASLPHVSELSPEAVIVDGAENPGQAYAVLRELRTLGTRTPVVLVVERSDLERIPWEETVDEFLFPGAPASEIRLRLAMLRLRTGTGDATTIRLGPMTLDADSYQVTLSGRSLDLTYKEFELLRYLASHPGRVFTRPALLREVWGYDFYGGTRTVDVHIRRLRSKFGPEHEHLIGTVRGVGYRASDL